MTWRWEMAIPERPQLRHQPRHGRLPLMVLGQHKAAQLRPEVAIDPARQGRHDQLPIRGQPALAAIAHGLGPQHEVLNEEVLVAVEARAGRHRERARTRSSTGDPWHHLAAAATSLARSRGGFGSVACSMPLGLILGRALQPLEWAIDLFAARIRIAMGSMESRRPVAQTQPQ